MGAGAGSQKITTDVTGNDTAGMVAGMVASGVTAKGLNGIEAEANKLAKAPKAIDGVTEGAAKGAESAAEDAGKVVESGGNSSITNDILECQRKGSALKVDEIKPITQINPKTRRPEIIKEFPATAQSHGFNDLIDNYAGYATKSLIRNGSLYQLKGTLNGVQGRFEWIIQDGYVTHRMFVQDGTMNGVPIKP